MTFKIKLASRLVLRCPMRAPTPQVQSMVLPRSALQRASSESKQLQPLSNARPELRSPRQFLRLPGMRVQQLKWLKITKTFF